MKAVVSTSQRPSESLVSKGTTSSRLSVTGIHSYSILQELLVKYREWSPAGCQLHNHHPLCIPFHNSDEKWKLKQWDLYAAVSGAQHFGWCIANWFTVLCLRKARKFIPVCIPATMKVRISGIHKHIVTYVYINIRKGFRVDVYDTVGSMWGCRPLTSSVV